MFRKSIKQFDTYLGTYANNEYKKGCDQKTSQGKIRTQITLIELITTDILKSAIYLHDQYSQYSIYLFLL